MLIIESASGCPYPFESSWGMKISFNEHLHTLELVYSPEYRIKLYSDICYTNVLRMHAQIRDKMKLGLSYISVNCILTEQRHQAFLI